MCNLNLNLLIVFNCCGGWLWSCKGGGWEIWDFGFFDWLGFCDCSVPSSGRAWDVVRISSISLLRLLQYRAQKSFRESVFQALFAKSERAKRKWSYQTYVTEPVESEEPHVRDVLERNGECKGCKNSGKMRQILGERDPNSEQFQRPKRTRYGCQVCEVSLCKEGSCWEVFHGGTVERA